MKIASTQFISVNQSANRFRIQYDKPVCSSKILECCRTNAKVPKILIGRF